MTQTMKSDFSAIAPDELNKRAEDLSESLTRVKHGQLRNVYAQVQRIRGLVRRHRPPEEVDRHLIFMKPRLAYACARDAGLRPLREQVNPMIDQVVGSSQRALALENFFVFMEAIVAYHKFYTETASRDNRGRGQSGGRRSHG